MHVGNELFREGKALGLTIVGKSIAIGSPSERTQGSVYLFHTNDSWDSDNVLSHRIEGDNRFGFSVKLSEEQLIIGSPGVEGNPGKASG